MSSATNGSRIAYDIIRIIWRVEPNWSIDVPSISAEWRKERVVGWDSPAGTARVKLGRWGGERWSREGIMQSYMERMCIASCACLQWIAKRVVCFFLLSRLDSYNKLMHACNRTCRVAIIRFLAAVFFRNTTFEGTVACIGAHYKIGPWIRQLTLDV